MRKFLRIVLVNGDVIMFPCEEVVDVVGREDTLEVQVLRCHNGVMMPYNVKVIGEGESRQHHWLCMLNNIHQQLTE